VPEYETISVNIEKNLKRKLEEYNFFHRDNKINLSALSRDALKKELEKRSQPARKEEIVQDPVQTKKEEIVQHPKKREKEFTCLRCGVVFTAKRSTRKFCSNKCRLAHHSRKNKELAQKDRVNQ
jgi:hypothetical protein